MPKTIADLAVKVYADGADKNGMHAMYRNPLIKGFTTNPTLMHKAGITNYEAFARDIVAAIPDRPISFEVFSDDFDEMEDQAMRIAAWGDNVFVKVPITNTRGDSSVRLLHRLTRQGVKLNVTALFTLDQVWSVCEAVGDQAPAVISVFAGRVADAGVDPVPLMAAARAMVGSYSNLELLWASPRELFNIYQAESVGCHIITVANDLLKKLDCIGKDLHQFSLETVQMFRQDAVKAGFSLIQPGIRRAA